MNGGSVLTSSVRAALDSADVTTVAADIKDAVCAELMRVDPAGRPRKTEYFNHSFVPDVVVEWPDQSVREVYLRFVDRVRLAEDIVRIGQKGPVLLDLSPATSAAAVAEASGNARDELLATVRRGPGLLFTDTEATEPIRPADATDMVERLITSNILRSARGVVSEETARATVSAAKAGFESANSQDPVAVAKALSVTADLLGDELERRVEKTLQLLWWAGGGDPAEFPSTHPDDMYLDPADAQDFLRRVVTGEDIDNDDFWGRLAQRLDFGALAAAVDLPISANFDRLMHGLGPRLQVSHAAVDLVPPQLLHVLAWSLNDGFVQLNGPHWVCRLTPDGRRFPGRHSSGQSVSLAAATDRSDGFLVEETEVEEPARRVSYARRAGGPSSQGRSTLTALTEGASPDARLNRLVVRRGARLEADFLRMMLSSEPDSALDVMAYVAVTLLVSQTDDDRNELSALLST